MKIRASKITSRATFDRSAVPGRERDIFATTYARGRETKREREREREREGRKRTRGEKTGEKHGENSKKCDDRPERALVLLLHLAATEKVYRTISSTMQDNRDIAFKVRCRLQRVDRGIKGRAKITPTFVYSLSFISGVFQFFPSRGKVERLCQGVLFSDIQDNKSGNSSQFPQFSMAMNFSNSTREREREREMVCRKLSHGRQRTEEDNKTSVRDFFQSSLPSCLSFFAFLRLGRESSARHLP